MHPAVERSFQEIDAAVFSSDTFVGVAEREHLRKYIGRWTRALASLDSDDGDENEEDPC